MSQPEQEVWKNKWLDKGLPETLLDEMIDEVNAEYATELGVWYFHRYAQVTVNVLNDTLETNEFYLYIIERASQVFYGKGSLETTEIFNQLPCTELVFHVFKLHVDEVITVVGYGFTVFTLKSDSYVDVTVSPVALPSEINVSQGLTKTFYSNFDISLLYDVTPVTLESTPVIEVKPP